MGNYIALCTTSDIQSKDALLKQKKILQIIKVDGKILEFKNPLIVKDLLVSCPNSYVGMFKEATQPLPLDHKLKIGNIYYLLPSLKDDGARRRGIDERITTTTKTTIKLIVTKEQLQQILSQEGRFEELLLGVVPNNKVVSSFESGSSSSCSSWCPKLQSIPEGSDVVC